MDLILINSQRERERKSNQRANTTPGRSINRGGTISSSYLEHEISRCSNTRVEAPATEVNLAKTLDSQLYFPATGREVDE